MKPQIITIDELKRLAETDAVSLPCDSDDDAGFEPVAGAPLLTEAQSRTAQVAKVMRSIRELTKNRSHYTAVDLERWLETREG